MDHQGLERLFRTNPDTTFKRVVTSPLTEDSYAFLLAHCDELQLELLVKLFESGFALDEQFAPGPFVKRLACLLPEAMLSTFLDVFRVAHQIPPEAWRIDVVLPLREKLEPYLWYRLVDKARGGILFNALNTGTPGDPACPTWRPEHHVWNGEHDRSEPQVVSILEQAHNDLAVARHALACVSAADLIRLFCKYPEHFRRTDVEEALRRRLSQPESWVPLSGMPQLPEWAVSLLRERLDRCEEQEAQQLFQWLFENNASNGESDDERSDEAFAVSLDRFACAFRRAQEGGDWLSFNQSEYPFWCDRLGRHLAVGTAWKTRGRALLQRCLLLGSGFPVDIVVRAIAAHDAGSPQRALHERAILRRAHDEMARLLVELAQECLEQGDLAKAARSLSAFVCLDPGSFIGGALRRLAKHPGADAEFAERVGACVELTNAGSRDPSLEALNDAFLALRPGGT